MRFALVGLALAFSLNGCGTSPRLVPVENQAPTFHWGETIEFERVSFDFTSARNATSFSNWVNQTTETTDNFVIVAVTIKNMSDRPLPTHFQPVFRLRDASGAIYEANALHTAMINMNKAGSTPIEGSMNPKTKFKKEIVFDAPRQPYTLQAIVPSEASVGFNGSVNSYGKYFNLELASQIALETKANVADTKTIAAIRRIDVASIEMLKPGVTTVDDAKKSFGEPTSQTSMQQSQLLQWISFDQQKIVGAKGVHISLIFGADDKLIRVQSKTVVK